jgi:DNA replication licensing factor MCM2
VPIAVRHIECICRIAEASDKMHLRQYAGEGDADLAIQVMLESFVQAQKVSARRALQHSFRNT